MSPDLDPTVLADIRDLVNNRFRGSILAADYFDWTVDVTAKFGMDPARTLPILVSCRDELISDIKTQVFASWGRMFSGISLGGGFTMGRTGVDAARRHIPASELPLRAVFLVLPHIGIDEDGVVGNLRRPGRDTVSQACGALMMMREQFLSGQVNLGFDPADPELSLLRQRMAPELIGREVPDLVTFTEMVRDATMHDVLATGVLESGAIGDVGLFSGLVINGPEETSWVWPNRATFHSFELQTDTDLGTPRS